MTHPERQTLCTQNEVAPATGRQADRILHPVLTCDVAHQYPDDDTLHAGNGHTQTSGLAASCVRFVKQSLNLELDFSPDTLPILDHYLTEARADGMTEALELVSACAGAYFGELVCQHSLGARWAFNPDAHQHCRIEYANCFLFFNPIGAALEAATNQEAHGWSAHFQVLESNRSLVRDTLERVGAVQARDFFKLSVRWEALELVTRTLLEHQKAQGEPTITLGSEVYTTYVTSLQHTPSHQSLDSDKLN